MDAKEAQKQIGQMRSFIESEARDKAREIEKKGEEEFSIEVHRLITEQKDKIISTYEKKVKQIDTQYAIAKSLAINKQRLEKIKARQEVMHKIETDVKPSLEKQSQDQTFVTKLIVQGLLMLLEDKVTVTCRQKDVELVKKCLASAEKEYAKQIKEQAGATKSVSLTIDTSYLPATCMGGVVLSCFNDKIKIDNTVDARLGLVMEQAKPAIRGLLFPQ
eukprot:CAMPEP_0194753130 /NCGR_PEP_ID=MMETSP0323_2-20130528/7069_1 /TAXON_ID=2866 ORGANISM="Crypthecodinium cohnii, Strain Seligo" /NCGR_SAMPLE_ID=MMETSP0323_2 /ASSEMBLY_ACC=CAM_ASM_000346 /LENGTH=217 /DNA_ID=CAMNT_0039670739 /DNA_START=27 /DNA_END=680 /DNA_ORIENTATION=+